MFINCQNFVRCLKIVKHLNNKNKSDFNKSNYNKAALIKFVQNSHFLNSDAHSFSFFLIPHKPTYLVIFYLNFVLLGIIFVYQKFLAPLMQNKPN